MPEMSEAYREVKEQVTRRLPELLDNGIDSGQGVVPDRAAVVEQIRRLVEVSQRDRKVQLAPPDYERLVNELTSDVVGIGPLEPLMQDPKVTEIMVNGPHEVFVERAGQLTRSPITFRDTDHLMHVIERMLDQVGLSVTNSEPCLDASLPDGSRINVIIPPLALNGPTLTLRKKSVQWTMDQLIATATLSPEAAEFLLGCIKAKVNLVISGGTSTGKTTLVGVLSSAIPQLERLITIENVAEFELPSREHWVRLVARSANVEGRGEMPLRTLVRNALRMRPDRIILGEARGGEALDVVQAMHTGHEGVITVLHGNSPQAALERLETLMLMSGLDLPSQVCQRQIASAVDIVVHMARFADGSRRVASIAHIKDGEGDGFHLEELYAFTVKSYRSDGTLEGAMERTGVRPNFLHKFQLNNVPLPGGVA